MEMEDKEIREQADDLDGDTAEYYTAFFLREIAAQLDDLNRKLSAIMESKNIYK